MRKMMMMMAIGGGAWLFWPRPNPPILDTDDPRLVSLKPRWNRFLRRWEAKTYNGWKAVEDLGPRPLA